MSSFLMGYPHHIQSPMGGSAIDPKFPPSTEDYQHHNGYGHGAMGGLGQAGQDYGVHHQNNGLHHNANNFNYSPGIGSHFYHHGYNAQMHAAPSNGYSAANSGYYGSYYGTNGSGHQMMDMPLQCSTAEPTNTVLGLQELGKSKMMVGGSYYHMNWGDGRFFQRRVYCQLLFQI